MPTAGDITDIPRAQRFGTGSGLTTGVLHHDRSKMDRNLRKPEIVTLKYNFNKEELTAFIFSESAVLRERPEPKVHTFTKYSDRTPDANHKAKQRFASLSELTFAVPAGAIISPPP